MIVATPSEVHVGAVTLTIGATGVINIGWFTNALETIEVQSELLVDVTV